MKNRFHFICIMLSFVGFSATFPVQEEPIGQMLIHFSQTPKNKQEHAKWNEIIDESMTFLNQQLIKKGYIASEIKEPASSEGYFSRIRYMAREAYNRLWYRTYSSKYSHKKNNVFFARKDYNLGFFAVHISDGVSFEVCKNILQAYYAKHHVTFLIDPDVLLILSQADDQKFPHVSLAQLESIKSAPVPVLTKEQKEKKKWPFDTFVKRFSFWHQLVPTIGLRPVKPFFPPEYPYIPHFFHLWQLAPKKGAGIKVAVIDTGIAAFSFANDKQGEMLKYRKNQDLQMSGDIQRVNYNLTGQNGLDHVGQFIEALRPNIQKGVFDHAQLEQLVPDWIFSYIQTHSMETLKKYLLEHGAANIVENGRFTQEGNTFLEHMETQLKQFHLRYIAPDNVPVIEEFLPLAKITDTADTYMHGHGSHISGLIGGLLQTKDQVNTPEQDTGICGIAPNAQISVIKMGTGKETYAERKQLVGHISTILHGLSKVIALKADIVNLSIGFPIPALQLPNYIKAASRLINLIPYTIATPGNQGDPNDPGYRGEVESFPARLEQVAFDVGAFDFGVGAFPIAPFSQYEPHVGPKFVAPGVNILSAGLIPKQGVDSEYIFATGTSQAAPIITGFVALMLGEFKHDFTREQLLTVCYASGIYLHNTPDWQRASLLGALDMRTALFTLHVIRHIKQKLKSIKHSFDVDKRFDQLVAAIHHILFWQPKEYGAKHLGSTDFRTNFVAYFKQALKQGKVFESLKGKEYFVPEGPDSLQHALDFVSNIVLKALDVPNITISTQVPQSVITMVRSSLNQETINLFEDLNTTAQQRLRAPLRQQVHSHWKEVARLMQQRFTQWIMQPFKKSMK